MKQFSVETVYLFIENGINIILYRIKNVNTENKDKYTQNELLNCLY